MTSERQARPAGSDRRAWPATIADLVERFGLAAGLAIMAVIGVASLGRRSFWMDEGYTWTIIAQPTWSSFIDALDLTASNMAGYMTLLRLWSAGGDGEAWLRLPSLLFALGTVFLVHRIARRAFDPRVGGIAALLAGASVPLTFYGLEARSYSMLAFFSAAIWYGIVRALDDDRWWRWAIVGLATLGAISAQVIALMALPSIGIAVLLHHRIDRAIVRLIPTGLAAMVGLAGIAVSSERVAGGFPPPLSPSVIARVIRFIAGDHGVLTKDGVGFVVMVAFGLLFVVGALDLLRRRPPRTDARWLMWIWFAGPPITTTVVSIVSPLLWHRMVIGSLPAALIVAALAIDGLPPRRVAPVVLASVVLLGAARSVIIANDDLGDYRQLSDVLLERSTPGDTLVFSQPWERSALDYYLRDDADRFVASPEIGPVQVYGELSTHQEFFDGLAPDSTVWIIDAVDSAQVWRGESVGDGDFDFSEIDSVLPGGTVIDSFDVARFRVLEYVTAAG